jgi:hypothetical protein
MPIDRKQHSYISREGRHIFVWSKMRVSNEMTSRLQMLAGDKHDIH